MVEIDVEAGRRPRVRLEELDVPARQLVPRHSPINSRTTRIPLRAIWYRKVL
jgi:hypothetical protein